MLLNICITHISSIAFDIQSFSVIPEVNPQETFRLYIVLCMGIFYSLLVMFTLGLLSASNLSIEVVPGYWLYGVGQRLLKFWCM